MTRGVRDYSSCVFLNPLCPTLCRAWIPGHVRADTASRLKGDVPLLFAIDISKWPGVNQAFLVSFVLATGMTLLAIPYGKRRPIGTPFSWGEAMLASLYSFTVMFIAYGVVPDRWIQHADKELQWTKQKLLNGPFDILKAKVNGGWFPFTVSYQELRDIVVVLIHVFFFALQIFIWMWWQNRNKKAVSTELETSSYGRPLVKKA